MTMVGMDETYSLSKCSAYNHIDSFKVKFYVKCLCVGRLSDQRIDMRGSIFRQSAVEVLAFPFHLGIMLRYKVVCTNEMKNWYIE